MYHVAAGVAEPIDLKTGPYSGDAEKQTELFDIMKKDLGYRALMAAAIPVSNAFPTALYRGRHTGLLGFPVRVCRLYIKYYYVTITHFVLYEVVALMFDGGR